MEPLFITDHFSLRPDPGDPDTNVMVNTESIQTQGDVTSFITQFSVYSQH